MADEGNHQETFVTASTWSSSAGQQFEPQSAIERLGEGKLGRHGEDLGCPDRQGIVDPEWEGEKGVSR
jgi:hypothetical protein